jgi:hypothetical protein
MLPLVQPLLLPIKTISTNPADLLYIATWDTADLSVATGYATIDRHYSLTIEATTDQDTPMFVGVRITSQNRAITIADRVHVGYLQGDNSVILSPASVPQLGDINWVTEKIEVLFYTFARQVAGGTTIKVQIRLDIPYLGVGAMPFIGRDSAALHAKQFTSSDSTVTTFPAGTNGVLISQTATAPYRYKIRNPTINLFTTPGYGDIEAILRVAGLVGGSLIIARYRSRTDQPITYTYPGDIYLDIGETFDVFVTNNNAGVSNKVAASCLVEFIY